MTALCHSDKGLRFHKPLCREFKIFFKDVLG